MTVHQKPSQTRSVSSNLIWTLAKAHLRRRRMQNVLAVLGVAVGVMVLIVALSLFNGFTKSLVDATLRAVPHLSMSGYVAGKPNDGLEKQMAADSRVKAVSPFLGDKALVIRPATESQDAGTDFVTLFGMPPAKAAEVLHLRPAEVEQLKNIKDNEIMLGASLASNIGAFAGDKIRLLNSQQKRREFTVAGKFTTGNYLVDSAYGFTSLKTLQDLQGTQNINGYQLRLHDPEQAIDVGADINKYAVGYQPIAWQMLFGNLMDQLTLQKRAITVVVLLIVMVAAFGIANVLTLAVFEKTQEIAILRAIGATKVTIIRIFVLEGLVLGIGGLLLGNLLGFAICGYFTWQPFRIPGDLYFISTLPVVIRPFDILWINAVGIITTILAALMPARRAASVEPAKIIR